MIVVTDKYCRVIKTDEGLMTVHRLRPFGAGCVSHTFATDYSAEDVADYIHAKAEGKYTPYIQDVFPHMSSEDREFLRTGITPDEWNAMFPPDEE